MRNLADTYRQHEITPMNKGLFSKKPTGDLLVTVVCGSIFGLSIGEESRPDFVALIDALEHQGDER